MNISLPELNVGTSSIVHLVRHGHIPDHRADHPLTPEGRLETWAIGQKLAGYIRPGETICFFSSPVRRARQTAELLRDGLHEALSTMSLTATVISVINVDDHLQNLQFYLDGLSYDPIRPLFDALKWKLHQTPSPYYKACVSFHTEFWNSPDPMDYWLTHPSQAVEAPEAVAKRTRACLAERLACATESNGPQRAICVAHSANLRAFLQQVFGADPGEPPFCGMATISLERVFYQGQTTDFPVL